MHEAARRTGFLRNFYVFGSFLSSIPEPRDVDVVLIMAVNWHRGLSIRVTAVVWHLQAEARYRASVFWFKEGTASKQYLSGWQLKRDGTLRGIVEVA